MGRDRKRRLNVVSSGRQGWRVEDSDTNLCFFQTDVFVVVYTVLGGNVIKGKVSLSQTHLVTKTYHKRQT